MKNDSPTSATIEQLWYTSSPVGLGTTGQQVRAASAGLREFNTPRFRLIEPHLRYEFPLGATPNSLAVDEAPVTLSLLQNNRELLLIHRAFTGVTWDKRPGNYFTHLLAGVPEDMHPIEYVKSWRSGFWRRDDASLLQTRTDLPPVTLHEIQPEALACVDLRKTKRDSLEFVLTAYLTPSPNERLFIAAPPDEVAVLIWALIRCLPMSLTQKLRFSTYEQDVTRAAPVAAQQARPGMPLIVGTCIAPGTEALFNPERLLPPPCYEAQGRALNTYTGQRSQFSTDPRIKEFSQFAASCLFQTGEALSKLDALLRIAERHITGADRDDQVRTLLSVYRFFASDTSRHQLGEQDISDLLKQPLFTQDVIGQPRTQKAFLGVATSVGGWWARAGNHGLRNLVDQSTAANNREALVGLGQLANEAGARLDEAILQGQQDTAEILLEGIIRTIDPHLADRELLRLLEHLPPPRTSTQADGYAYPLTLRLWLLQSWSRLRLSEEQVERRDRWLQMPWAELLNLLESPLPGILKVVGMEKALAREDLSGLRGSVLNSRPESQQVVQQVLKRQAQAPERQAAFELYMQLVNTGYTQWLALLEIILPHVAHIPRFADTILEKARLPDAQFIAYLEHYPTLTTRMAERPYTKNMLLRQMTGLTYERAREHLPALGIVGNVQELSDASEAVVWLKIISLMDAPRKDHVWLRECRETLALLPTQAVQGPPEWLLAALTAYVRDTNDLYDVINYIGDVVGVARTHGTFPPPDAKWYLYPRMLEYVLKHNRPEGDELAVYVYLAFVGWSKVPSRFQQSAKDQLEKMGPAWFDSLKIERFGGDEDVYTKWQAFTRKHRPATLGEKILGAAAGIISKVRDRLQFLLAVVVLLIGVVLFSNVLFMAFNRGSTMSVGLTPSPTISLPSAASNTFQLQNTTPVYGAPNSESSFNSLEAGRRVRVVARSGLDWLQVDASTGEGQNLVWVRASDAGIPVDQSLQDIGGSESTTAIAHGSTPTQREQPTPPGASPPAGLATERAGQTAPISTIVVTPAPAESPSTPAEKPANIDTASPTVRLVSENDTVVIAGEKRVSFYRSPLDMTAQGIVEYGIITVLGRRGQEWLHVKVNVVDPNQAVWVRAEELGVRPDPSLPEE